MTEQAPQNRPRPALTLALLAALALALFAGFVSLGIWQVQRLHWKTGLIAQVDARLAAPPVAIPGPADWAAIGTGDAYLKVTRQGRFLHGRETLVQAVTDLGGGFWVMTPLVTEDGTFLVNRGFVPLDRRDPATRAAGQADGPVSVTGLLRITEPGGAFLRANDPQAGRWYSRDVAAIAAQQDVPAAPFFVDADATPNPGGYPVGGLTVVTFRNSHLGYALTWFAMAFGTLVAAGLVAHHERRLRRQWLGQN